MQRTGIVFDSFLKKHDPGPGHPEQPARVQAISDRLNSSGTMNALDRIAPRPATDDDLALAHDRAYIELVKRDIQQGRDQLSTGDTSLCEVSLDCARLAAGSVLSAADAVLGSKSRNAFCLVRPPGHHAEQKRGMGFCLFNNVAIGARYAQHRYGAEHILIADWDVHHGNGTQQIFYGDPSVFFFSTHQSPWYPGTGAATERGSGKGEGTTLNCPFPAGSGRDEIVGAFRTRLLRQAKAFRPDLVLISAGFDSRAGDPLGRFLLQDADFVELTECLLEVAGAYAGGRLISVLEGGYNLTGLASAADAHITAMASA